MMIQHITCLLIVLFLTGCPEVRHEVPTREFNTQEFAGLVSTEVTTYKDALLDYELDASKGGVVHFTNCAQVDATGEGDIVSSQYPLFKLLSVNCQALRRYAGSSPAKRSCFPDQLTEAMVSEFPALAVPRISEEEMTRRQGKTLAEYNTAIHITVAPEGSVQVVTDDEEMTYYVMARADFDGDGAEDMLMRVDWHARNAFGQGTDLFILTKTSDSGPVTVSWRR